MSNRVKWRLVGCRQKIIEVINGTADTFPVQNTLLGGLLISHLHTLSGCFIMSFNPLALIVYEMEMCLRLNQC